MAKRTKKQESKLVYIEEKNKKNNNKKLTKQEENKDELFSFDNEIIIGVTKKEEPKKETKKQVKKEKKKIKTENKKVKQLNKNNSVKKQKNKQQTVQRQKVSSKEQEKLIKKRKRIANTLKYGTLVALVITAIICAMFSPLFNIKTIKVEGNKKITEKEIISLSQIQLEQNIFKLSKNKIEKQIKQNSYINKVTITRNIPSTIILKIEEREPAYLLEYAGSYVYLDRQGYMLEINATKLELPILQGAETPTTEFIEGKRLINEDLEKLSIVLKIMELAKVAQIDNLITRIDIENKQNLKLIFESKEKTAYLGDSSNLNTKILTIKSILEKEEQKAGEIFVNMDLNKEYPVFRERV